MKLESLPSDRPPRCDDTKIVAVQTAPELREAVPSGEYGLMRVGGNDLAGVLGYWKQVRRDRAVAGRDPKNCPILDVYPAPGHYMIVGGVLTLLLAGAQVPAGMDAVDTTVVRAPVVDTLFTLSSRRLALDTAGRFAPLRALADEDTLRRRRRAVEVGEWYSRRLTIHRYTAYATIPVFALQYAAGNELNAKGSGAPTWAKTMHRVGATMLAGMFTVNTVTGAWNWWDSRSVPQGRILRTVHALTMLGTDFAFTYTGAKLSEEAENSDAKRRLHYQVAMWSMGVTVASETAMILYNRNR